MNCLVWCNLESYILFVCFINYIFNESPERKGKIIYGIGDFPLTLEGHDHDNLKCVSHQNYPSYIPCSQSLTYMVC